MCEELKRKEFHEAIDMTLSGLQADPWLAQRVVNRERTSEPVVKKKLSFILVCTIIIVLVVATALAVTFLSPKDVIERVAVPIAVTNDQGESRTTTYSKEDLIVLIQALSDNGFHVNESSRIQNAISNDSSYDEDEAIMDICCQAFGADFDEWNIEQKYWYETILQESGHGGEHVYMLPAEEDLTEGEAIKNASVLIKKIYSVVPSNSGDSKWSICPYLYAPVDTDFTERPAIWEIWFTNRDSGETYIIRMLLNGDLYESEQIKP